MKTVKVKITETLEREVSVEIEDDEDSSVAIEQVESMYKNEEIVLGPEDFDGNTIFTEVTEEGEKDDE